MHDFRPSIIHVISTLEGGGTERGLAGLLQHLPADHLRHKVVTLRRAGRSACRLPAHVGCRAWNAKGRSAGLGLRLGWELRESNVGLLHVRGIGAWVDGMLAHMLLPRSRLVLGFHGLAEGGGLAPSARRKIAWGLRSGAQFTSVSYSGRDQLVREGRIPPERVTLLPNGVDALRFAPGSAEAREFARRRMGFGPQHIIITCTASFTPVKGHSVLLQAFAEIARSCADARLLLIGEGPLRGHIEHLLRESSLSERVLLAGEREDVASLLGASDLYVCASRSEGMSHAVLEAMACGLPIVATDVGDNAEVLAHGEAGLLVSPEAATELAAALKTLLGASPRRIQLARAALAHSRRFSLEAMVRRHASFYEQFINHAPAKDSVAAAGALAC